MAAVDKVGVNNKDSIGIKYGEYTDRPIVKGFDFEDGSRYLGYGNDDGTVTIALEDPSRTKITVIDRR